MRCLELEKERRELRCREAAAVGWCPEVDLSEVPLSEELVPTAVGDRDSPERRHSAADLPEFTRLHFHERRQDQRCQWCKYRKACPLGAEHHDANAPMAQVLLVTKILIGRDERVVLLLCCVEEWAVVQV
jgi:hypothetical protein